MLLSKNNFEEGDIVSVRLISGDEIIGKFVSQDMLEMVLDKPIMIAMTSKGPGLMPIMVTVDPDTKHPIQKSHIMFRGKTVKDVADQYLYQTTGIQPVSAGGIVS